MAGKKTAWEWIKANALAIFVPLVSGALALLTSYGSFVQQNTTLINSVNAALEGQKQLVIEIEELDEAFDDLEELMKNRDDDLEDDYQTEIRGLERQMIRLEGRVDSIGRRLSFMDGIGIPGPVPGNGTLTPFYDVIPPTMNNENLGDQ